MGGQALAWGGWLRARLHCLRALVQEGVDDEAAAGVSGHAGALHGGGADLYAVAEPGEARHGKQTGLAGCHRA